MDRIFEAEGLSKVEAAEGNAEGTSAFLGQGSFGYVFLCYDAKLTDRLVAVKQIHRHSGLERDKQTELVTKEIATMLELRGRDNMVSLLRYVETPACFLLVTEYCNGGNLRAYLKRHCIGGGLPETTIRHFFRQIAVGLRGLVGPHGQILHRDLKPENVLLCHSYACDDPPPCDIIVKLADFGGARILSFASEPCTISVGTPQYWAPEIEIEARNRARDRRSKCEVRQHGYSRKVDLYSIGVMMYECLTGGLPFEGYNPERHDVTPDGGSANIRNLIEGLLKVDPQLRIDRLNASDIMSCSFSMKGVTLLLVEDETVMMVNSPLALRVCSVHSGSFVTEKVEGVLTLGLWYCPIIPGETIAVEFFTGHFVLFVLWTYREGTTAVIWIPADLLHHYRSFRDTIDEWVLVSRRDPPSRRRINPAVIEAHFNDVIGPMAKNRQEESTDVVHEAYERFADNFVFLPDVLSHSWRERDPVILTRRYRSMSEALEAQLPEHLLVVSDAKRGDQRGESDSFWTKDRPDVNIPRRLLERSSYLQIGNANNRLRQLSADMVSVLCGQSDLPATVDVPSRGVVKKQLEKAADTVLNRFMHGPVEVFSLRDVT